MRQKEDQAFLNRVRKAVHTEADLQLLCTCVIDTTDPNYMADSHHIFARNSDLDTHNEKNDAVFEQANYFTYCKRKTPFFV